MSVDAGWSAQSSRGFREMLSSVTFENYRGFREYRLSQLARVNLLVGKNNCGKSSALEGVQLLASGGDPTVFGRIGWQRGEMILVGDDSERLRRPRDLYPDISHFFYGHEFGPGAYFRLDAHNDLGPLKVSVVSLDELEVQGRLFEDTRPFDDRSDIAPAFAVKFEGTIHSRGRQPAAFPVSEDGAFPIEDFYRFRHSIPRPVQQVKSVHFITPDSLDPRLMGEMWDKVVLEGREDEVIEAMRILEPDLAGLFFLSGERVFRYGGRGGVLLGFRDQKRRVPLGSHGEGMRRLLALSLSLIRSQNGVLLLDEIDTGLHYSIMGDMWLLVVNAAKQSNVQVFATTHSFDCIRGLAWLCENHPELADEVSLQRIDPSLDESVTLHADEIRIAEEQEIEVR